MGTWLGLMISVSLVRLRAPGGLLWRSLAYRRATGRGAAASISCAALLLLQLSADAASASSSTTRGGAAGSTAYGLDVVRLESARLALVGLSAAPTGTRLPPARLLVSTSFGTRFADISPRSAQDTHVDDVQFLDREHGWVAIWNIDTLGVTVYRTTDGGQRWSGASAGHHSVHAGAVATLQFLTRERGWLVVQEPTAPFATLSASRDGGASWHRIADLPEVAPVEFASPTDAWQAGGPFSLRFFHSTDGGRSWQRVRVPAPPGERTTSVLYGAPAFFGGEILEPVTFARGRTAVLGVYRSTDGGRRWTLGSSLVPAGVEPAPCEPAPLSASFATPKDWWVTAYPSGRPVSYRTTDAGRRWRQSPIAAQGAVAGCPLPQAQAVSAQAAWVLLRTAHDFKLYATSDAGSHWHALRPRAPN